MIGGSDRAVAHGYVICVAHPAGQQRASDNHRWAGRAIVRTGRTGIRGFSSRALIACLCAVAVVAALFAGAVRSSAAATGDQSAFMSIVSVATTGAPAKKPCQRGGVVAAGAICAAGFFVGIENVASDLAKRLPTPERIAPARRFALAAQCCGAPLLRPPRTDF